MTNEQLLLSDIVQAIHDWMAEGKNRSLSGLSRRCGVAYSTIRRIAQNESVPHPYTALSISEVVFNTQQRLVFLKKHFPTFANLVEECITTNTESESDDIKARFLRLEPHNRIFNMAATSKGVTRQSVATLCGTIGSDALNEMLDFGLLLESPDGAIKYSQNSWGTLNIESVLDQLRKSVDHFDKDLVGTDGAAIMHLSGSVKPEVLTKLKQLTVQYITDFIALKEAKESEGDVHFFCDLMYSLYDRREWESNREKIK